MYNITIVFFSVSGVCKVGLISCLHFNYNIQEAHTTQTTVFFLLLFCI